MLRTARTTDSGNRIANIAHLSHVSAMHQITISNAANVEPSSLAAIRVEAMRPSLEAIGRFDPERARNRFLEAYAPNDTHVVHVGGDLVGFYVVRNRPDHLYLDHLYIRPARQGGGLGREIVHSIQSQARELGLPVRLMALRGSPANDFYVSCGFVLERSDDLDNYYTWMPT